MKIQTKIAIPYILFTLLIILGLGIFTSLRMESFIKARLVDELGRQADVVFFTLQNGTSSSVQQLDQRIKQIAGIERLRITIIDAQGTVLSDSDIPLAEISGVANHSDRPEIQKAKQFGSGSDVRLSATVHRKLLYVAKQYQPAIRVSGFETLRYIRMSILMEEMQAQINSIRSIVIFIGLGILLVILAVSIIVSRRITKPMAHIVKGVEKIRSGDLDAMLDVSSNDEIGLVSNAVNELVQKLKSDIVQLKKLEQVRSQFLGNVSHELRTPIFAVQGYLETLIEGAVDDPAVNRSFLEKAQSNLDRLNALLEDLINISQIESGEMKMSLRYFRINEFLESAGKDYESLAASRDISLNLSLQTSTEDEVFGDRDRLRQVLNNLISNAISYNKPGGSVTIGSEKAENGIQLSVRDTGTGIPPEHLTRIFERFYRVDSDRSRSLGGTGLGLAIVKHIVEAHGSRVNVESSIGEGSVFRFLLKNS